MNILITGANGFIGRHLVEKLSDFKEFKIFGLVHNRNTPVYRYPSVTYIYSDILDKRLLFRETSDMDIIVHCAYGNTKNTSLNQKITVEGTKNILEAAKKNKVKKIIYLSTAAVYETKGKKVCDENTSYVPNTKDPYVRVKIEAEKEVWKEIKKGSVNAVVLQPTIVYGPCSRPWAKDVFKRIKEGSFFVPSFSRGLANFVYVDDVVKTIILSIKRSGADNQRLIISGQKSIPWLIVFRSYKKICRQLDNEELKLPPSLKNTLCLLYRKSRAVLKSIVPFKEDIYQNQCVYSIKKAQNILDYQPEVSFQKGILLTKKWLKGIKKN